MPTPAVQRDRRRTAMNALAKVRRAWHVSGWRGVAFGTLGALGVRLAGWYVRSIDVRERPPSIGADVSVRLLEANDWPTLQRLRPALEHSDFLGRLEHGDLCAAAVVDAQVVAVSWLSFTRVAQPFLDLEVLLQPGGIYTFEAYVHPDVRGRRIHGLLSTELRRIAFERGARYAHSLIGFENAPSLTAMRRLGYERVGTVFSIGPGTLRLRCCTGPGGWQVGRRLVLHLPAPAAAGAC